MNQLFFVLFVPLILVGSLSFISTDSGYLHLENSIQASRVGLNGPSQDGSGNPCPEGQFLDIAQSTCFPLAKNFGFQLDEFVGAFENRIFNLDECTGTALDELLDEMTPTGGTALLPECVIEIDHSMTIPSNVIFQGSGIDKTTLVASPDFTGNMLRGKEAENIIIRDLTLDGMGTDSTGIVVWYVRNVLIERVRVHHNGDNGITFRYATQITVRYSESHDHTRWHGINSKDCFPDNENVPDLEECREDAGETSPGVLWSRDYALYSNRLYNNGEYGINAHASFGEIAGNLVENNLYGSKFPDASFLWIHQNRFAQNHLWGTRSYNTLDRSARLAKDVVFYQNQFEENGDYPIRVTNPAQSIFIIDNQYQNNSENRLRIDDVTTFICPDTAESSLEVDGDAPQTATLDQCTLANIAELFELSTLYLPYINP
ncbi:MAG: right-handed parallel beta-helix repeat-containing protein [Chloroflexota bacterium]